MTSGLFIAYWALICSHSGIWNFDMPWAKEALTLQLKPASCLIQNASLLKLITLLSVSVAKLAAPSCCSTTDLVHETYRRALWTHATRCLILIAREQNGTALRAPWFRGRDGQPWHGTWKAGLGPTCVRQWAGGTKGLMYRRYSPVNYELRVRFWFHSVDGSSAATPHHRLV
jgi:hypothetical protein